jgi:hypothetical protein
MGGAGLRPAGAQHLGRAHLGAREGAHGGTLGSPVLNREDALIMWKDPVREPASA